MIFENIFKVSNICTFSISPTVGWPVVLYIWMGSIFPFLLPFLNVLPWASPFFSSLFWFNFIWLYFNKMWYFIVLFCFIPGRGFGGRISWECFLYLYTWLHLKLLDYTFSQNFLSFFLSLLTFVLEKLKLSITTCWKRFGFQKATLYILKFIKFAMVFLMCKLD